jgi:hypothetical protein
LLPIDNFSGTVLAFGKIEDWKGYLQDHGLNKPAGAGVIPDLATLENWIQDKITRLPGGMQRTHGRIRLFGEDPTLSGPGFLVRNVLTRRLVLV